MSIAPPVQFTPISQEILGNSTIITSSSPGYPNITITRSTYLYYLPSTNSTGFTNMQFSVDYNLQFTLYIVKNSVPNSLAIVGCINYTADTPYIIITSAPMTDSSNVISNPNVAYNSSSSPPYSSCTIVNGAFTLYINVSLSNSIVTLGFGGTQSSGQNYCPMLAEFVQYPRVVLKST